jgi:uncharacterized protein (TIRG00374 family)
MEVLINRRAGLLIAQTLLGLALLVAWVLLVDLGAVGRTLSQARWMYVLLAAVIALSSSLIRSQRWRLVLGPIASVPLLDLFLIIMASGLVNFVIPLRTGEIARSLLLKQRHRVPMSASLPTIAVDRSFDLLAVLVVGTIGALSGIRLGGRLSTVLLAGGLLLLVFVVFVILAILSGDRLLALADRLISKRLASHFRDRILGIIEGLLAGFTAVGRQPKGLLQMITVSFLSTVLDGTLFYLLFLSIGADVPYAIVLTGYALFALTFLVPGAPGYIGSMEAFGSLVFSALGVGVELAASAVILFHALNALMLGVVGGLAMWTLGLRPASAVKAFVKAGETNAGTDRSGIEGIRD